MTAQPTLDFGNWTPAVRLCACGKPVRIARTRCGACEDARRKPKPKPCIFCGTAFVGHHRKLFCQNQCLLDYNAAWREVLPPRTGRNAPRKPKNHCSECGKELRCCSGEFCTSCRRVVLMRRTKERQAVPRICELCGKEWKQKTKASYKTDCHGKPHCGRQGKYCPACRQISDRILKFGVEWEPVSETTVFERDGWKCGACGISTPKELLGTMEPNAPSLEHLYPISLGGAHSYKNCALSCRACNSNKRNHVSLEPRLKGVTDFAPYKIAKYRAQQLDHKQMPCACGCGEYFVPSRKNKSGCKHGHWYRTEAGQRLLAQLGDSTFLPKSWRGPYEPLIVDPDSRLGKKLAALHQRQEAATARAAARVVGIQPLPVTSHRSNMALGRAEHTALSRSGMSVAAYVKANLLLLSPSCHTLS